MATIPVECYVIECNICHDWSPVMHRVVYPSDGKMPHPDNWLPSNWDCVVAADLHICPKCRADRQITAAEEEQGPGASLKEEEMTEQ